MESVRDMLNGQMSELELRLQHKEEDYHELRLRYEVLLLDREAMRSALVDAILVDPIQFPNSVEVNDHEDDLRTHITKLESLLFDASHKLTLLQSQNHSLTKYSESLVEIVEHSRGSGGEGTSSVNSNAYNHSLILKRILEQDIERVEWLKKQIN